MMDFNQTFNVLTKIIKERRQERIQMLSWSVLEETEESEELQVEYLLLDSDCPANIVSTLIMNYKTEQSNFKIEDLSQREWKRNDRDKLVNEMYEKIKGQ